ncbi:family 20 glycosylhydrolase [Pedobacter aquatilis]|uniref:glycoside hydrolase family 20 protein n=1 Tax=Pedobacter aquatilis TaxID=351343 RepID=UPI0025B41379|nr:family 20 glycosylhydrolase [Pedobacter aquatilis]MDN3585284.1 family 20 glycosylhydrolase [Pedobacter aquatilis]
MIKISLPKVILFKQALTISILVFATILFVVNDGYAQDLANSDIIPKPLKETKKQGYFTITANTKLFFPIGEKVSLAFFNQHLNDLGGFTLSNGGNASSKGINLILDSTLNIKSEGYFLSVSSNKIDIKAKDKQGLFYGLQSLIQLIKKDGKKIVVQAYEIADEPRFAYRGMHLDVARNMFSVASIKKWLQVLAFYKINTFHWHLTDDQGWRVEIKKYPLLQTKSAYRNETLVGHKRSNPHIFDGKRYGGYYTQEEIKDVVQYAAKLNINTIPEIEMPGHARAVLAAYPNLGCTGGPYQTATFWGVFDDVFCAGNEETFAFLEGVLDEVVELFPSKYIHIGGDECPKTRWHDCPKCQKRIIDEQLKDEHELQSYFITRMETYLHTKGKKIIGWDEILEGGLAPDATVMSWRGLEGGIAAAKLKHDVIMTPEKFLYLDYYQSLNKSEQTAAGGYLPLRKVYEYEPMPEELNSTEQKYIKGVQANVWTEYMPDEKKAEYMIFPRIVALSEMAWSTPKNRNYADFLKRLQFNLKFLKGINYSSSFYEVMGKATAHGFVLQTDMPEAEIRYTLNGAEPTKASNKYTSSLTFSKPVILKAQVFKGANPIGKLYEQTIVHNLATGKRISLKNLGSGNYNIDAQVLVNGLQGSPLYNNGEWLGLSGTDFEAVVDLGKDELIKEVGINILNYQWQKMHPPTLLIIEVSSDGNHYKEVSRQTKFSQEGINSVLHKIEPIKARYVHLKAANIGTIPNVFYGAGSKALLMVDEIIVN